MYSDATLEYAATHLEQTLHTAFNINLLIILFSLGVCDMKISDHEW